MQSLVELNDGAASGVVLDTVKLAEDGSGLVLRLFEAFGARSRALLRVFPGATPVVRP